MRPNLWRWVGIGMLGALGVAWLTELWLTTRAPWRPWLDVAPPPMVAPARRVAPSPSARSKPARAATMGSTVIVERADGTAEQVNVGPGQTIIVGTDGSIHLVTSDGPAAAEQGPAQAAGAKARLAAAQRDMAGAQQKAAAEMAARQDVAAAQQKAMAMGNTAVAIRKVAPPETQIIYQQMPAGSDPTGSDDEMRKQPADVAGTAPPVPPTQP